MRRRIFNFLSALSLLLCAATVVLWVRSHWADDEVSVWRTAPLPLSPDGDVRVSRRRFAAVSTEGVIYVAWHIYTVRSDLAAAEDGDESVRMGTHAHIFSDAISGVWYNNINHLRPMPSVWQRAGFHFDDDAWFPLDEGHIVGVPYWFLFLVAALLPARAGHALVTRSHRKGRLLCPTCSYNLTGNLSGVCPECGTPVAGKAEG